MRSIQTRIVEIGVAEYSHFVQLERMPGGPSRAGQYYLAYEPGQGQVLAAPLYPCCKVSGEQALSGVIPAVWMPGTRLAVRGPLGQGFELPPTARRVAVVSFQKDVLRLSALFHQALRQQAAIVMYTDVFEARLPEEIEILPLDALPECWPWADYAAIYTSGGSIPGLRERLNLNPGNKPSFPVEVLIDVPMVCGGLADCGICAVPGPRRWMLACKEGPVFPLEDVEV